MYKVDENKIKTVVHGDDVGITRADQSMLVGWISGDENPPYWLVDEEEISNLAEIRDDMRIGDESADVEEVELFEKLAEILE